ncbi:Alpha-1,2-mannosyltransferase MNN21 [Colletotrichum orbiculare MAFF 240422]|uniref:Alpha-1,2-mannosyltransferase MNN21 n=1 Tax=Colletotrichum orbiculare (strain 104-T / ATCC 96160 / CBS 514.97 / LARS 414 / MAFF 240422) TaxID=1213857 RepID=N4W5H9_COLOR|nr:Alpha-1,2-mannosyltransferase MNN21 [Colletotrichum orbiculare MAFF 240422]
MLLAKPMRRPPYGLLLAVLAVTTFYLYHPPSFHSLLPSRKDFRSQKAPNATAHLLSETTQQYWSTLHATLKKTSPSIPPLKFSRPVNGEEIDPGRNDNTTPRPDLIQISAADLEALKTGHRGFVSLLKFLAPRLPRWKGSKGVVLTAGGGYLGDALTSILMLRRSGSQLPAHVFVDTPSERDPLICDEILPRLNVECLVFSDLLRPTDGVKHYQYKVLSILLSPFEKVLYLDADAWPIRSPDTLFASEPFTTHGLISWPDFWVTTISPVFHRAANISASPVLRRRSSESGILLYDKSTHADSLLLSTYYNWYGPGCYYPLLSQGAPGEGDKETFVQAALALGRTFWDVRTPVTVLGRWINGTFETSGMKQADPERDFQLQKAHGAVASDHAREPPAETKAAPLFIHHNLFKVDIMALGRATDPMFRRDEKGRFGRLWGPDRSLVEDSGYDVERAMWDTVLDAHCAADGPIASGGCVELEEWYKAVFVDSPPLVEGL